MFPTHLCHSAVIHAHDVGKVLLPHIELRLLPGKEGVVLPLSLEVQPHGRGHPPLLLHPLCLRESRRLLRGRPQHGERGDGGPQGQGDGALGEGGEKSGAPQTGTVDRSSHCVRAGADLK